VESPASQLDPIALAAQVSMGLALAACAGLRAFLPLLIVGTAGRLGWVPLSDSFAWLQSTPALVVFGIAVAAEILADKIPVVDHTLDVAQTLIKPVAGTLLAASVMTEVEPLQATVLALITGGLVSETVHLTKAKLRLLSTVTTAGVGNPVISTAEDLGAVTGSFAALAVPFLVAAVVLVALVWVVGRLRPIRAGRQSAP